MSCVNVLGAGPVSVGYRYFTLFETDTWYPTNVFGTLGQYKPNARFPVIDINTRHMGTMAWHDMA